jgi:hypothetical protein
MLGKSVDERIINPDSLATASMAFYDAEATGLNVVLIPGEVNEREVIDVSTIEQSIQERRRASLAVDETTHLDTELQ